MIVSAIHTSPITINENLFTILDRYIPHIGEDTVVAITSKIVSLTEKRVIDRTQSTKQQLAVADAELYLPAAQSQYGIAITIRHHILGLSSGVDSLNTDGYFVLLPYKPQESASTIWTYLKHRSKLKNLGVVITDSHSTPLHAGVTGICLAHCGFMGVNNFEHQEDIFGKKLHTRVNVANALAVSATFVMGESNEQTPLAIITDIPHIVFCDHPPTDSELNIQYTSLSDDVYAPLLLAAHWEKGIVK